MAQDLNLQLKIKALVEGINQVKGLSDEVAALGGATRRPFADPSTLLRAGAARAQGAIRGLVSNVFSLRGALAGLGVGLVAKGFLDVAREAENIGVRMRFLTESTAEAAEATRLLQQYAARSPAEFAEISAAAPNLLVVAKNVGELNKLLEITGDLSAVSGLSFQETAEQIQRAMSAGAASADLFQQRGVSAMLGFQAGVSVSAEETKRRIFDLWFGPGGATNTMRGAAAEMSRTWDGLVSMQIDKWGLWRRAVMDAGPFEFLKAAMAELDANVNARFGSMQDAAGTFGREMVTAFEAAIIGAAALADDLSGVASAATDAIGDIWSAFSRLPTEIQTAGVFAVLMFGKRGLLVVGGLLAGMQAVRDSAAQTFAQIDKATRAAGVEPPTSLLPRRQNQAAGRIERAGQTPPPDDGLDPESFEARARRIIASINARIAANRELASAQGEVASGGTAGGASAAADTAAVAAAEKRADAIATIIEALREQAATEGLTAEQVALYRLAENGATEATLAQARALIETIAVRRQEIAAMDASARAAEQRAEAIRRAQEADQAVLESLAEELHLITLGARERAQEEASRRLSADATDEQRRAVEALAGALYDQQQAAQQTGDQMSEFAIQGARNMQSAFADFLFDPFSQGLQGMLSGFVSVIHRMVSEALAAKLGEALFGSLLTGGAGAAAGGAGGASTGLIGGLLAGLFHTGGIAGNASAYRRMPAVMLATAPRYHGGGLAGLAPDEVPAVLRRGEEVLTQGDPRHRNNGGGIASSTPQVTVRNINLFDTQMIGDYLSTGPGEKAVLNIVSRNKPALGLA